MANKPDDVQIVKIQVEAGNANPGTVGSILGQYGVNLRDFCTQFNDASLKNEEKGTVLPVTLTIKKDRSFDLKISAPPVARMIVAAIGCKGSGEPNRNKVGKLTKKDMLAIVEKKKAELTGASEQAMLNTVAGTARSMGVEVELEDNDGK